MRQVGEIPHDYAERVYSGVLGKLIGVYLGRPFEGWSYEDIAAKLGDIRYYVHDREGVALRNNLLVVTDDDIAGTFVFARALEDHGYTSELSARQVGQTWLNYIVRERSVLWWGGPGNSTEHTAFMRLDSGVPAPQSGSIAMNGKAAAEQIGAQIFIDGWAMAAPGNPALAARLAGQAARVSHDGIAVHAAQLIAAMEAQAFVERDMDQLIDTGLAAIPADSTIRKVVDDVRRWHAQDAAKDWRSTRERIAAQYGYDRFEGLCHVVPNHALVILSLLYGQHSFDEALSISCTAGWDTDCNAGNVGWHELYADDGPKAFDFYCNMFGWEHSSDFDMGAMGVYKIFKIGDRDLGGIMTKPAEMPVSAWNFYFNVPAIDAAVERVNEGGGKVVFGPMEVPGGSWVIQGTDPQGAFFSLVAPVR